MEHRVALTAPPLRPAQRDTLLLELRDGLGRVEERLELRQATLADHEGRLRFLERWRYGIPGTLAVAVAALTAALFSHM